MSDEVLAMAWLSVWS